MIKFKVCELILVLLQALLSRVNGGVGFILDLKGGAERILRVRGD